MRYAIVIEAAEDNFSAYVPDLPGCVATGNTVEDTERSIREAIEFHLDGLKEGQWRLLTEDEIEKGLGCKCGCLGEFNDSTPKTAHKHKRRGKGIPRRINGRRRR